jgi:hypothetical protein
MARADDAGRGLRAAPRGAFAQERRWDVENIQNRGIELTNAGKSGGERYVRDRELCGLYEDPSGLRALGAGQRERADPEFGRQQTADLPLFVPQAVRETLDTLAIHRPVGDQSHGAAGRVGPDVPFRRTGGGVRPAPFAGAKAGFLGGCGRLVEADILPLRRDGRAGRTAVDTSGGHGGKEHAVEPGILAGSRVVALLVVHHALTLPPERRYY